MCLRTALEDGCAEPFHQAPAGRLDLRPGAARQFDSELGLQLRHAAQELLARKDARSRHGDVALGLGPLVEPDLPAPRQKRAPDQPFVRKFIRQHARTGRHFFEQVFNDPRMSPGQQPVQVAEFGVKPVVGFGTDHHRRPAVPGDLPDPGPIAP